MNTCIHFLSFFFHIPLGHRDPHIIMLVVVVGTFFSSEATCTSYKKEWWQWNGHQPRPYRIAVFYGVWSSCLHFLMSVVSIVLDLGISSLEWISTGEHILNVGFSYILYLSLTFLSVFEYFDLLYFLCFNILYFYSFLVCLFFLFIALLSYLSLIGLPVSCGPRVSIV